VRKGLQEMEGVKNVEVSLEKGLAKIELNPANSVTLSQIQTVVEKNGFSPKSAQMKLKGKISNKEVIVTTSNEAIPATVPEDKKPEPDKAYEIQGNLVIEEDSQQLTVTAFE
jgi:copper chaperone CopZ